MKTSVQTPETQSLSMNSNNVSYVNARLPERMKCRKYLFMSQHVFLFVTLMLVVPVELW